MLTVINMPIKVMEMVIPLTVMRMAMELNLMKISMALKLMKRYMKLKLMKREMEREGRRSMTVAIFKEERRMLAVKTVMG